MYTRKEYTKVGGFFSDREINQMKREAAKEAVAPLRQNLPYIALGVAAITAWQTQNYGLLATVVSAGVAGAISYTCGPRAIDTVEDFTAKTAQFQQRRVYR